MKFREHRGGLDESLQTMIELANRKALVEHCHDLLKNFNIAFKDEAVSVDIYSPDLDNRTGWKETYIVSINDHGIIGFTDEPC